LVAPVEAQEARGGGREGGGGGVRRPPAGGGVEHDQIAREVAVAAELPAAGGEVGAHLAIGELGRVVEGEDRLGPVLRRRGRAGVALRRGVALARPPRRR